MWCEVVEGLKDHVPAPTGQAAVGDHLLALGDKLPDADTQTLAQIAEDPEILAKYRDGSLHKAGFGRKPGANRGGQRRDNPTKGRAPLRKCTHCGGQHVEWPCPTEILSKRQPSNAARRTYKCNYECRVGEYSGTRCGGEGHTTREHVQLSQKAQRSMKARTTG